jgi:hypothetical protein
VVNVKNCKLGQVFPSVSQSFWWLGGVGWVT